MASSAESWYQSIFLRHSERIYSGEPVDDEGLSRLEKTCREFRPFNGARAELVRSPPVDVFKGIVGSYGKVRNARHYIAFIGDMRSPEVDEALGFMGEGIILEATSLGINTCWVAGFFHPTRVAEHIDVYENEEVAAVTPVGYAEHERDRIGALRSGRNKPHKRRDLINLISAESSPPKKWMQKALEAARLAPSAVNRQPWRFLIEENAVTITAPSSINIFRVPYRIDCGIAMLHLELGALAIKLVTDACAGAGGGHDGAAALGPVVVVHFGWIPLDQAHVGAAGLHHDDHPVGHRPERGRVGRLQHRGPVNHDPVVAAGDRVEGFAQGGRCTVQLELTHGEDPHHSWEAACRAFGVALRTCFRPFPFRAGLTVGVKGTLD